MAILKKEYFHLKTALIMLEFSSSHFQVHNTFSAILTLVFYSILFLLFLFEIHQVDSFFIITRYASFPRNSFGQLTFALLPNLVIYLFTNPSIFSIKILFLVFMPTFLIGYTKYILFINLSSMLYIYLYLSSYYSYYLVVFKSFAQP